MEMGTEAIFVFVTLASFVQELSCARLPDIPLSMEKQLIKELLRRYENVTSLGRPVSSVDKAVNVRFGLGLIQMDLDEKSRALALSVWIKMIWQDEYMTWDPEDFGNISSVKLASEHLWIPDVMLYNTAETETSLRDTATTVHHNGTILWVPHQKMKSSCSIDVTNFPFDTQHCHMWFGSWTYTTKHLNLTMSIATGIDLETYSDDFKDSNQWEIVDVQADRQVLPSIEDDPNYAVLTYGLTLRRNVVFASYILTLPCVFLACLTLVVFWLPPDRPDRTALAMSTFSSFLLLLLILVEAAPPTASSVPRLGIYYCFNMVIIMLSIFLSSLVVNVCRMGEGCSAVPGWLRKFTIDSPLRRLCFCEGLLPTTWVSNYNRHGDSQAHMEMDWISYLPLLGSKRTRSSADQGQGEPSEITIPQEDRASFNNVVRDGSLCPCLERDQVHSVSTPCTRNNNLQSGQAPDAETPCVVPELSDIHNILESIQRRLNVGKDKDNRVQMTRKDWRGVSVILDRVFFFCYLILITVSIVMLFPRG